MYRIAPGQKDVYDVLTYCTTCIR